MLLELIEGSFLGGDDCKCDGPTSACYKKSGGCVCRGEGGDCAGYDICGCNTGIFPFVVPIP